MLTRPARRSAPACGCSRRRPRRQELAHLGPEALGIGAGRLGRDVRGESRRLHSMLRDQRVIAGIGRAWANEILHQARLSPYALSREVTTRRSRGWWGDRFRARARARATRARRERQEHLPRPQQARRAVLRLRHADRAGRLRGAHGLLLPLVPDRRARAQGSTAVTTAPLSPTSGCSLPWRSRRVDDCRPIRSSTSSRRPPWADTIRELLDEDPTGRTVGDDGFHPLGPRLFLRAPRSGATNARPRRRRQALSTNETCRRRPSRGARRRRRGERYELVKLALEHGPTRTCARAADSEPSTPRRTATRASSSCCSRRR